MHPFQHTDLPFHPAALIERVGKLIPRLGELQIGPENVLAVQSKDPAVWPWIWALAHAVEQPFMPLNPDLTDEQVSRILASAGNAVLLDRGRDNSLVIQRRSRNETLHHPRQADAPPWPTGLIIHTSGSEGQARGVMLSAPAIEAAAEAANRRLHLQRDDLWLLCLAPWHIGGMAILERTLLQAARVSLLPGFDAETVWARLRQQPVTHLSLVPAMLARLLEQSKQQPPPEHLRKVLIGGGALSSTLYRAAIDQGWPLCVSYGLSEAGSQVATLCTRERDWQPGRVGHPLNGMQVRIAKTASEEYGPIQLRGPMLMTGYLNPALQPGVGLEADGWFQTNDLGRLDEQGSLQLLGRSDAMIISGGINVHPAQIEQLLQAYPGLREVVVTGTPDPVYGEIITAVVSGVNDMEQLLAWCRDRLPAAMRPRRVICLEKLPLLSNGKIDRLGVERLAAQA